ncbi:Protein of unknown function [Pyronema omphalodes CBS 100304]|uniref:Uncharacterized protein n=1 Tax=Pyronema omphalodes (strain CBS 100304) TaxID=1076935 RepID=U4LLN2_PYROM|nr:Protein of unknown function [Pyronema omphalodes CBS 100304]
MSRTGRAVLQLMPFSPLDVLREPLQQTSAALINFRSPLASFYERVGSFVFYCFATKTDALRDRDLLYFSKLERLSELN